MKTGETLLEHSYEYHGPLALCGPGEGEDGAEGEGEGQFGDASEVSGGQGEGVGSDPSPGEPGGGLGGLAGAQSGEGGEIGDAGDTSTEGGGGSSGFGEFELSDYEALKDAALEDTASSPSEINWGRNLEAGLTVAGIVSAATLNPGLGLVSGVATALGMSAHDSGAFSDLNLEGPGPAQTPDTSDTGGTTEGGEGGQRSTSRTARASLTDPSDRETSGLISPEIEGEALEEEEETLGRGRKPTQTLLTGGRGARGKARTRRRTLLAA